MNDFDDPKDNGLEDQQPTDEQPEQAEEKPVEEEKLTPPEGTTPYVTLEQVAEEAADIVGTILSHFPKIKKPAIRWRVEDESIWVDIEGDPSGRLIGRRGQTIDAFQHVISKVVSHRFRKKLTVNVDAEKYKQRQREKLEKLAVMTADYVSRTGEARALEPMNPAERRLVHIALRNRNDILTASEGKEPHRFVVIWPNTDDEE